MSRRGLTGRTRDNPPPHVNRCTAMLGKPVAGEVQDRCTHYRHWRIGSKHLCTKHAQVEALFRLSGAGSQAVDVEKLDRCVEAEQVVVCS